MVVILRNTGRTLIRRLPTYADPDPNITEATDGPTIWEFQLFR